MTRRALMCLVDQYCLLQGQILELDRQVMAWHRSNEASKRLATIPMSRRDRLIARLRKLISDAREAFWVVPAAMVLAAILAAFGFVYLDRSEVLPRWLLQGWIYNGGPTGARTLLGAIASSAIGVAGTVFSITIAALSLAAGQMGPRLLRNFTRDRGNQFALGVFISTFPYALTVLRTIRTTEEGEFVPHLSLTIGILLAFVCIATLVWFVAHMAGRINVDLVSDDLRCALENLNEKGFGRRRGAIRPILERRVRSYRSPVWLSTAT